MKKENIKLLIDISIQMMDTKALNEVKALLNEGKS